MRELKEAIAIDPELARMDKIMRKGREYLKTQSMQEIIENDPDLPNAEALVDKFFSEEETNNRKLKLRRLWIIGAFAIATIALLITQIFNPLNQNSLYRLYGRFYAPIDSEEIQNMSESGNFSPSTIYGLECYASGRYEEAVDFFIKAGKEHLFLGISYLGNLEYEKARLSLLASYSAKPTHPVTNWYLGLSYIKLNERERATYHLQKLLIHSNPYQKNAQKILKKLQ
jgi:hypothetical protein